MPTPTAWLDQLERVGANPAAIQRLALEQLDETLAGSIDVVDATNPFLFLMESSAINAANGLMEARSLTRKQYPTMALTDEELYLHMSDIDYADRFAIPSRSMYYLLLGKEELYAKAVPTGVGDVRKLTIPRNTQFTINEINFTMQYPIDIRIMSHGGLQIVYNTEQKSPLEVLDTNIVNWKVVNIQGIEFVRIEIPVDQFTISTHIGKLNYATGFSKTYPFDDEFYYARAFYHNSAGDWVEFKTTHTDQVFDPTVPTLVLKVLNGKLQATVPQVYMTHKQIGSEIRLDVYTTKGPLNLLLGDYDINNFTAKWIDLAGSADSAFFSPLSTFTQIAVYSDQAVVGGRHALTFDELRERVIVNNLGDVSVPITNVQLTSTLQDLGYDPVCDVDNITNRVFLATRTLPVAEDSDTISGAALTIQTLQASMSELSGYSSVSDNGDRVTIKPSALFELTNGILSLVPDTTLNSLETMTLDAKARYINQHTFLYTPFHYVLDKTDNLFDLRAYYLDAPLVESKVFVEENDTTGIEVGTDSFKLTRIEEGYELTLVTKSSDAYKTLEDDATVCQLAFVPSGEKDRAYLNGTLTGFTDKGERVYTFQLGTPYDLDHNDDLTLDTFQMYSDGPRNHATALSSVFDVFYVASGISTPDLKSTQIDLDIGKTNLPSDAVGVAHEQLTLKLGSVLKGLWRRSRSVASSEDYKRYSADVPAVYEDTVYNRDPTTGQVIITQKGDGTLEYSVLHAKGDPVLDDENNPVMAHHQGDVILDPDGKPVVVSTRSLLRQVDLCLVDGVYWFATEMTSKKYKVDIPKTLVAWVTSDIEAVSERLLEQTHLYFYPKSTMGDVKVGIREGKELTIPAAQSFSVTYYLTPSAYRNADLRQPLTEAAISVLNNALTEKTIAINEVIATLTASVGGDVIAIDVKGLGGPENLTAVTLKDDSSRLSIAKLAVAEPDGTIGVQDGVAVTFLEHVG